MTVKIVPDLTILEQGVGPAIDVWPDTAAGSGSFTPVYPPVSWSQPEWFVDPSNVTGLASDSNSGMTALTPVLSYSGGIVPKWRTTSPVLRQNTTITWLSSQPTSASTADPVIFTPVILSTTANSGPVAIVVLQGVLNSTTQIHAGTLGAVVPKNRATAQLLTADLGFAAPIGTLIANTTAGKLSYASVYKNVSGTVFALSQPSVPQTPPASSLNAMEVDTWSTGDTFVAYALTLMDLIEVGAPIVGALFPPNFGPPLQVQFIRANGGVNGDASTIGNQVSVIQCVFDLAIELDTPDGDIGNYYEGVAALEGVFDGSRAQFAIWATGFILSPFGSQLSFGSIGWDAILDGTASNGIDIISRIETDFGVVGGVYVTDTLFFATAGTINVTDNLVWGPGGLDLTSATHMYYGAGTAVATFLQTGATATEPLGAPFGLNELPTAYAIGLGDPAPWHPGRLVTAANLDLSVAAGGFGGVAVSPGGAGISTEP